MKESTLKEKRRRGASKKKTHGKEILHSEYLQIY